MKRYVADFISDDDKDSRIRKVLEPILAECGGSGFSLLRGCDEFIRASENGDLKDSSVILAVDIGEGGVSLPALKLIDFLWQHRRSDMLKGSVWGIIIDGKDDFFTKDLGRRLAFTINAAGGTFPGKPLVEATGSLKNFKTIAGVWNVSLMEAYGKSCRLLLDKVCNFKLPESSHPSILAIHASNMKTSNSLALWNITESLIRDRADTELISIRNGQLWDCRGCKYEDCLHFGERGDCFYGGVMVEKVYPAMLKSDVLVLICPNYNDSVSANIMAFINRLTALFRAKDFSRKKIYAVIVSGYSGGDLVAQQIIGAINMNKNLILPPRFALMATANDPGEAGTIPGIEEQVADFAKRILGA